MSKYNIKLELPQVEYAPPPLQQKATDMSVEQSYLNQWEVENGTYKGIGSTVKELPPNLYNINLGPTGLYFSPKSLSINDLIRFKDSSVDEVMREIDIFWKSEEKYRKFDVQYKRGILMVGPPGSGKSSIIKMLIRDVISRGGIAIDFTDCRLFEIGMDVLRKIHSTKPIVCIMEDLESIVRNQPVSSILNLLDGSTNYMTNIIFVATSNYPEALEARIKDRPSRFDRVIEVGLPSSEMRQIYLDHLFTNARVNKKVIKKWVTDTEGLTFPHLQELFLSVNLYDIKYDDALGRIKSMSKPLTSDKHRRKIDMSEMFEEEEEDYEDDYLIVDKK